MWPFCLTWGSDECNQYNQKQTRSELKTHGVKTMWALGWNEKKYGSIYERDGFSSIKQYWPSFDLFFRKRSHSSIKRF